MRAIEIYCQRNGHQLIKTYVVPAGRPTAHIYQAMADDFRADRPALVIVPDASHVAEDLELFVARIIELTSLGAEVRCTDADRPDPLQSAEELLTLQGRSAVRQKRVRDAIMAKASRGQVLGRTPYGYSAGLDGQLKPVPPEVEVVKKIFEWYAGPWTAPGAEPLGGIGLRLIAQRLNGEGRLTRQGRPWTQVAVSGILRNRSYLGTYSRYGIRIVGSHKPVVDRETFNKAEAVMEKRRPARQRRDAEPFLLSGLVRSGMSGTGLFGLTRRRRWKNSDGTPRSKIYRYYESPVREPRADGNGDTIKLSWPAGKLESAVIGEVAKWPERRFRGKDLPPDEAHGSGRAETLRLAERDFARAVRSVASGHGTVRDLARPLDHLIETREKSTTVRAAAEDASTLRGMVTGNDPAVARRALRAVVERVIVQPDSVEVVPKSQ